MDIIYEFRALTEDFKMQTVDGCQSAFNLFKACIIPSLLSHTGTWVEIDKKTVKMLNNFQDTFGKVLLSLPSSAQSASLLAELGLVGMKWRAWEAKILMVQAFTKPPLYLYLWYWIIVANGYDPSGDKMMED